MRAWDLLADERRWLHKQTTKQIRVFPEIPWPALAPLDASDGGVLQACVAAVAQELVK